MCGIFGYAGNRKNAADIVLSGLKSLEYRGYDSWGIAAVPLSPPTSEKQTDLKIQIIKKTGHIENIPESGLDASSFAFGHTRWATHGGVTEKNAHPHLDCTKKFALIHNGIIENYRELRKKVEKLGHKITSDTDSEVAVHLIEEYAKSMLPSKAVQKAFNEIRGLNAFIIMSLTDHRLIAVRNGSPLVVGYQTDENFIASDAMALLPYTKQVHFLEDNQMAIISKKGIMIFNAVSGEEIEVDKVRLDWSLEQTVKGKYPYFMLKEIHEQPAILADIAGNYESTAITLSKIIQKSYGSYLVGCGTASYACMAGSYLFAKVAQRHINWAISSEFGYQLDFLTAKSLVIALSQSGETMDTLDSVNKAHLHKAKVFALVNVLGSTLYRTADYKTLLGAGPEKGVASTKAFTAKLGHLILLSYAMIDQIKRGKELVSKASLATKQVLNDTSRHRIRDVAKIINKHNHVYVLGRGMSFPASLETALKIKEISYIHAEGLPGGELKHGPLALVDKNLPCIVFAPHDETYEASIANAMEMRARGGKIIGIAAKNDTIFDYFLNVNDIGEATIIPQVVTGQLLAYELALMRGFDPDKPRNLAKSVTVK